MTKAELIAYLKTTDVEFGGGQDYGFGHDFCFVAGFRFGAWAFVLRALQAPHLDPGQKLEYSEPIREMDPRVWGDMEDPGMVEYFRKHRWRMETWTKAKGSVKTGIEIVQDKLMPPTNEPELFFVFDTDLVDDEMNAYLQRIKEHAWKLDAGGKPTDQPAEEHKDAADALRYWIMNRFPFVRGGLRVAGMGQETAAQPLPPEHAAPAVGGPNPEMKQIVKDLIGSRPRALPGAQGGGKGRLRYIG